MQDPIPSENVEHVEPSPLQGPLGDFIASTQPVTKRHKDTILMYDDNANIYRSKNGKISKVVGIFKGNEAAGVLCLSEEGYSIEPHHHDDCCEVILVISGLMGVQFVDENKEMFFRKGEYVKIPSRKAHRTFFPETSLLFVLTFPSDQWFPDGINVFNSMIDEATSSNNGNGNGNGQDTKS